MLNNNIKENELIPNYKISTAVSPSNLAVIKYWGKRNVKLNLPINSSVSITLDHRDELETKTSCCFLRNAEDHSIVLNGKEDVINKRILKVIQEIRTLYSKKYNNDNGKKSEYKIKIVSENSFPTAAGLASSAAGYSCLVISLANLFEIDIDIEKQFLSTIARQGSGSATRSLYGGFVKWEMGSKTDGSDSFAVQIADENHWDDIEAVICVVSDHKKKTSSTKGMIDSVNTSEFLKFRAENIVNNRIKEITQAYMEKDFKTFAKLTMIDSNQFHSTCLDTYPPIFYLNDISKAIIETVHELNEPEIKYCYTFDAGPNAVIFCQKKDTKILLDKILTIFPPSIAEVRKDSKFRFVRGRSTLNRKQVSDKYFKTDQNLHAGTLSYVYHTGVGKGTHIIDSKDGLIKI